MVCASHGQHLRLDGGVRREGGTDPAGAGPRGQDRGRQDGAGDRARRPGDHGARQLRRLPRAGQGAGVGATPSRWSTRSTRSGSRARRPRPSRSSTSSATPPTYHLLPVGNAGNISAYWLGYTQYFDLGLATRKPRHARLPGRGRGAAGHRRAVPRPGDRATAIRIGNPASWKLAEAAAPGVRRPVPRGERRPDPGRSARARRPRTACSSSPPRPPASPGCSPTLGAG